MWGRSSELRVLFMVLLFMPILLIKAEKCAFVNSTNENCVKLFDCDPAGNSLEIFEDCEVNEVLFTYTDTTLVQNDPNACPFMGKDDSSQQFKLIQKISAEQNKWGICLITSDAVLTYTLAADINEYYPQSVDGSKVQEVYVSENLYPQAIWTFAYTDDDEGETETLQFTVLTENLNGIFNTTQNYDNEQMDFTIEVLKELDYEERMFYKLEYNIISIDTKGAQLASKHTVFVYVEDVGDNAPYWLQYYPTYTFLEGKAPRTVFQVIAEDRDLAIQNHVRYSISNGNEENYFKINEDNGTVTLIKDIDREKDTSFFILEITAQEHYSNGTLVPEPSSSTTVCNLNIDDENDNIPTFNDDIYEIEMDEVEINDVFMTFDIPVFVVDMDPNGNNGRYTIESDKPNDIKIEPSSSFGNTTLQLTALAHAGTIFDYEVTQSVTIKLTATESVDSSHVDTATIIVTLKDANDHTPQFLEADYSVDVDEDKSSGYYLVNVTATDGDASDTFGTPSIRYTSGCPYLSVDAVTGEVTLSQDNYLDFESEPEVMCQLYADDNKGDAPTNRNTTQLYIHVLDVVDSPPTVTVQNAAVTENSPESTPIDANIFATDTDDGADIEITIDWTKTTAQKDGEEVNPVLIFGWFTIEYSQENDVNYTATLRTGPNVIDREIADTVSLAIMVEDKNTVTGSSKATGNCVITINDEKDTPPQLSPAFNLAVQENVAGGMIITMLNATDADVDDSVTFSIDDNTLLYVEKAPGNDFGANLKVNESALIDREERSTISVNVTVTDSVNLSSSMEYIITVTDVNDNIPIFSENVILATFTESDSVDKVIQTFEARDMDLNYVLTYSLLDDFEWHEGGPLPAPATPFVIETENNVASLILNFNPVGINSGYCIFTIVCHDNDNLHNNTIEGKVYAITIAYQINVIFLNSQTEVQSQRKEIESIFSDVYKYDCNINSIAENTARSAKAEGETLVKMHFIDEGKNEPVAAEVIIEATNAEGVAQELSERMTALGLDLKSVGNNVVGNVDNANSKVLLFQILLAVISLVLGSLFLLLLITYCIKTKKLERQLKVAKATSFDSMSSNINRTELVAVPGSNKFAGDGSNPMYDIEDSNLRNDDASSNSGDSVLVGVEENPEFKDYKVPMKESKGTFDNSYENASFSRSIDDVAGPSPFAGGPRTNPLLDADIDVNNEDVADAMRNYDMFIRRKSDDSGDSFGASENPNFSFGPN